ncbi:MAG: type IV pilus biogenesis/stability protein PilW [Candidatus Endonucleobacter sp. (ex Gigantidas childressi)]|nr:type IV pilus biogenesis/stability protein PilW [Candidatus Endonucleobacter sp. (ex Gigantidas childressi)]
MVLNWRILIVSIVIFLIGCSSSIHYSEGKDKAVDNYIRLAQGYIQEGYIDKALKPLNRALVITPRSSKVYGMLALVYQLEGEDKQAEISFKKALSYDSDASDVQNNYGAFLFYLKRFDEAYRSFSNAAHNLSYEKRSRAFENMGIVAQKQGREDKAKEHFKKALRLDGNLAIASLELSSILQDQGEYSLAWSHYLVFVKQSNQSSRSLLLGIQLARENDDRSAAASYALQLKRMHPESKEYLEYRSQTRE